jgi:hypothetical protein
MKVVAALLAFSILTAGCFPHNAKRRTYAKAAEGGALAAGIGMLYFVNTGADCDKDMKVGESTSSCKSTANIVGTVGLGLIIAGLSGFIVTVSTEEDDKPANTLTPTPIAPADKPATDDTVAKTPALK